MQEAGGAVVAGGAWAGRVSRNQLGVYAEFRGVAALVESGPPFATRSAPLQRHAGI